MKQYQKGSTYVVVIICIVAALIAALAFILLQNFVLKPADNTASKNTSTATDTKTTDTQESLAMFTSSKYQISFSYPKNWTVTENVTIDDTSMYGSEVSVKNGDGVIVAALRTANQLGGACGDTATAALATKTTIDDSLSIKGISSAHYGYTISKNENGKYKVLYYGLNNGSVPVGDVDDPCLGMDIGFKYVVQAANTLLGSVTFGSWAVSSDFTSTEFSTLKEAEDHATSADMKQVESMIKSLSIGS